MYQKKILNPDADELSIEPIEILIREKIGTLVSPDNIEKIPDILTNLNQNTEGFTKELNSIRQNTVFNIYNSSKIGVNYIQKIINDNS